VTQRITDAAAAGSTGNAEVSNETPTPSPDVGLNSAPREPTEAMTRAGYDILAGYDEDWNIKSETVGEIWRAMWDAYQKAP
jgi:hypothetical protein